MQSFFAILYTLNFLFYLNLTAVPEALIIHPSASNKTELEKIKAGKKINMSKYFLITLNIARIGLNASNFF